MKTRLCVLFGGCSSEHEVSLQSAASVLANCDPALYELIPVGITRAGQWLLYGSHDWTSIADGSWTQYPDNRPALLSPDRTHRGLLVSEDGRLQTRSVDCVFPVLHGKNGEDGTMQGLLDIAGLPYVGCGCAASAVSMDKSMTKLFADRAGVAQAAWRAFDAASFFENEAENTAALVDALGLPLFVKPAGAGSSVGVAKVKSAEALAQAVREATAHDRTVVCESFVDGQEIEVSVLGDYRTQQVSVCGEIRPAQDFYSYDAKYNDDASELIIPARIPEETAAAVRDAAVRIFRAVGGYGMARVDFFVRNADKAVIFNEINTIPGFTRISMYPKLFAASGLPYARLIDRLVELALAHGARTH